MLSIGIPVFDQVNILDVAGLLKTFSTATTIHARTYPEQSLMRCFTIAGHLRPIRSDSGIKLLPDCIFPASAEIDILLVPGGELGGAIDDAGFMEGIRTHAAGSLCTLAIGNGIRLLEQSGIKPMRGKIMHAADTAAALKASIELIERFANRRLAKATAVQLSLEWKEDGSNDCKARAGSGLFSVA